MRKGSDMHKAVLTRAIFALAGAAVIAPASLFGQDISEQELRSLDEQVQEVKSDVLSIAAELGQLEEKLLYPSDTELSVFVEMTEEEPFRLDAVRIAIDGDLAAHYIYSFKELEALQKGGVQRIYTGNIRTGEHRLEISVSGKLPDGSDYSNSRTFSFDKGVEPKLLGITLANAGSGPSAIQLGNW